MKETPFTEVETILGYPPTFHDARVVELAIDRAGDRIEMILYYADVPVQGRPKQSWDESAHIIVELHLTGIVDYDIQMLGNWMYLLSLTVTDELTTLTWTDGESGMESRIRANGLVVPSVRLAEEQRFVDGHTTNLCSISLRS